MTLPLTSKEASLILLQVVILHSSRVLCTILINLPGGNKVGEKLTSACSSIKKCLNSPGRGDGGGARTRLTT